MAAGDFRRSNRARDYIQGHLTTSSQGNINLQQSESLRDAPDLTYFIPGGVS